MHEILKSYLKRLTNLTSNNRSLFLLRLNQQHFVDLNDFNFLVKEGAFTIIESLIAGKAFNLLPLLNSRDEETNVLSRRLRSISRAEKFIYEEKGAKDLYVGWPFIKGKLSDDTPIRCPLLFFPVTLELSGDKWVLARRDDPPFLNKTFLLAYSHFNKIKLDDELVDRNLEDFDTDSTVFRTSLYQLIKDSPIELNFNQDNFQDLLTPFTDYKKAEFDESFGTGELKLYPEAVLGIFPQSGSYLVPDYTHLLENKQVQDIEAFFHSHTTDDLARPTYRFGNMVDEEKTFTPFKLDAHQEEALREIKKGKSIVVQGPPGTGKSQLICNLIADQVAAGKRVLVVSQKRAALDVVYRRMHEKDMTPFLGLVHDFKNDRKELFQNIARQIDRIDEYKMINNGLDAIQLERNFVKISRRIDQITEEMEEFKYALFDEKECGISVKELYLTSDPDAPTVNFKQEYMSFRLDELDSFIHNLHDYATFSRNYGQHGYLWHDRKSFAGHGVSDLRTINEILDEIPAYQEEIAVKAEDIVGSRLKLDDFEAILGKRDYIVQMLGTLKDPEAFGYFQHLAQFTDDETSALWLSNIERVIMECYKGEGPETSLPTADLGKFQEALQQSLDARNNILSFIKWYLFSKERFWVKRVLIANGLRPNKEGLQALVERIDNRLNLEHNLTKLREKKWVTGIPGTYEKVHYQNWFHVFKLAIRAKLIFNSLRHFKQYFNVQKLSFEELKDKIERLFEIIKETPLRKERWLRYLTESQVLSIENNTGLSATMKEVLRLDFEALCEFDKVKEKMAVNELKAIEKLLAAESDPDTLVSLFQNSVRLAWIEHVETKYPILRSVSSRKFHKMEAELQNLVKEKLSVTNDMLLLRCRERTYVNAEHNRLNNMVTYRDLHHQVTKKRRLWPLRKLIANHYSELFDLMPCWLASPESVSAIFPMQELFDLVIFDEASQCFAERGIPAMYRGRKVLVAGDSKQLQPNDLYQVRFDDEADDPDLEVDSLLELASRYLKSIQLNGHYRSRSLDLIDFSNQHFYDGKLRLLPDYHVVNSNTPGIDYIKVDGIWEKNVNDAEADAVVDILVNILGSASDASVGVVTFNARQQQHILDKIDDRFVNEKLTWPEQWFVKNIENVQGDEKDIIIFSTAYAPDANGKMNMQFGSLNALNGENRLNVAITRAREKVIIVSSIMPNQLKVDDTRNAGPKLLKKYLEYAWQVSEGNYSPTTDEIKKHSTDWYLKTRIQRWINNHVEDYRVSQELPFADLTVRKNSNYLALFLTDDDLYYQSPSVKDSHVYTPFTLSKKHWRFKGFFSREWWHNREQVESEALRFVETQALD